MSSSRYRSHVPTFVVFALVLLASFNEARATRSDSNAGGALERDGASRVCGTFC
jgi:hypothetical protein